jgi:phage FluMu gp28-like protein
MRDKDYFLPYQCAWIRDKSLLRICEKGRQIGMSYADSYDSVKKAAPKGGLDVWVMSRDERQAQQYIRYCRRWARALDRAFSGISIDLLGRGKSVRAQVLEFRSGARIYGLSSNPDAIVGKTGHVKLDEFALHRDQRRLYAVAKPVIHWGGTLSVISTHRGEGSVFNQVLKDIREQGNRMGWSLHTVSIQRAVEEGLVEEIEKNIQAPTSNLQRSSNIQAPIQAAIDPLLTSREEREKRREAWLAKQRAECIDEEQWLQE